MAEGSRLGSLLSAAAVGLARADRVAHRARCSTLALGGGFFSRALTDTEQTRLSAALYERAFHPDREREGLMPWEERWYEGDLPAPPARVLVAAAGGGREVLGLLDRGYEVDAFDPCRAAVRHAKRVLAGRAEIVRASYADLVASRLSSLRSRYDAVLLGWGSLSHVIGAEERSALVARVDALAADGPVLASFYLADEPDAQPGRAARAGETLGRMVGVRRGGGVSQRVELTSWGGFVRSYAVDEIEALGASVGRRVRWHLREGMPHVTLRRSAP